MKAIIAAALFTLSASIAWAGGETPSNPDAKVYFVNLSDGDTVQSPVTVVFGLNGMGVAPSGVEKENTGHHHLLIDTELSNFKAPIPNDEKHRHFGGGQTETTIDLAPGKHSLQLVLGNFVHVPHDPPVMSKKITITVK